ncbi:tyrosyl-DNA phosphodiesterase 2-like [Daphnia carinata]|uniref:tyrosyl-DNA phosphodiesterase 2-like n=1 Tax=Daphnia carinata TaxID=120202 RepID=UPI00257EB6EA|nr:tyrosyl-DNA phosphodiesterase 2-like [Daphnia carinata]XP_057370777.1 tyrosyl-DNA phosphodiesterase 2-like [Daphnia carinata]XP_059350333.1 tyrosyl-DNA phosphodiesterase 2-like [Daphnia carinata]XP_059350334.1 tyrosyl-DNA phosphodiesterase 2-like [Daphnia carinata]
MNEASSSQSEDGYVPNAKEAADLVTKFAEVTGTDTACAQFYLQDRDWDLQRSLDAYFGAKKSGGVHVLTDGDEPQIVFNINKDVANKLAEAEDVAKFLETATTKPPSEFRMISWNIDGLDDRNLKMRTKSVVKILQSQRPDIVFLQEVIPKTLDYLENNLPEYKFIAGDEDGYFTVTMLNMFTIHYDSHDVISFPQTTMGRNLLKVEAHMGTLKLKLLNTHMESTGEFAAERMNQLNISFREISETDKSVNVVMGGDLNMRDKELANVGGLPDRTYDVWEACGSRKECQWTWDTMRNTNKEFPGQFKPRCRFDRIFLRPSTSNSAVPKFFGLIGLQKISGYQCFPSDHWGLLADFDVK